MATAFKLLIIEGPDAPREVTAKQSPFRVGRGAESSLVLSDRTVSRQHFRLVFEGSGWVVEDLGSASGLEVNDHYVTRATLHDHDLIRAGTTLMQLRLLDEEPSPRSPDKIALASNLPPAERCLIESLSIDRFRKILIEQPDSAYAILDACGEWEVPSKVDELGERATCLYSGDSATRYRGIAPYLARLDEPLLDWIIDNLWGKPWGVVAVAPTDLKTLRRHFRQFLQVNAPDGRTLMLRYYDPRVLPTLLDSLEEEELIRFFGPVTTFGMPGEAPEFATYARNQAATSPTNF